MAQKKLTLLQRVDAHLRDREAEDERRRKRARDHRLMLLGAQVHTRREANDLLRRIRQQNAMMTLRD